MEYIVAVIAAVIAGLAGYVIGGNKSQGDANEHRLRAEAEGEKRAKLLTEEASSKADSVVQRAEVEAEQLKIKAQKSGEDAQKGRRAELDKVEAKLDRREEKLDARSSSSDARASELEKQEKDLRGLQQSIDDKTRNVREVEQKMETTLRDKEASLDTRLQEVAGLSRDEARDRLIADLVDEARIAAAKEARQIEDDVIVEAEKRAKKVIAVAVQRYAGEYVTERCVSVVNLPSDDMKGRIIGREGRNIRALEAATGVDFIVDDTPEAIIVSAFDPVRREIARLSMERLLADGRIHPARIEEVVAKTQKDMDKILRQAGEAAAFELGLTKLHPEIIKTMGRLKYRTSYGQNMWSHSIEVGFLCGLMADELGLNTKIARRAGFLHDIGKAMDHDMEGGHAIIGGEFIKKHGESALIVNAVAAHHDEVKQESVYAHLVISGDALSGARPGARREITESYIKRLEDLEAISRSFRGVEQCYAIQAGREVRVIVSHQQVSDDEAVVLSRDIAKKIEDELTYPGQVKVVVIRETRATGVAR